jgi:hypothetical protein
MMKKNLATSISTFAAKMKTPVAATRTRAIVATACAALLLAALYTTSSAAPAAVRALLGRSPLSRAAASAHAFFLRPALDALPGAAQEASDTLISERRSHTATRLKDGRVLVTGGENSTGVLASVEIYDPASRTFTNDSASLGAARTDHAAVRLNDGRIFIAGGRGAAGSLDSTEVYDPTSDSFGAGPVMTRARAGLTTTLLADGRVLVAGGDEEGTAEIFDPQSQSFAALDAPLNVARLQHSALLLQNGQVLVVGGQGTLGNPIQSAEIFDPGDESFSLISGAMSVPRTRPVIRELPGGLVQIIGGGDNSLEIYVPAYDDFEAYAHLPATTPLADVLNARTRSALFRNETASTSDPQLDRSAYTVTEIPQSNQALVAGGANSGGEVLRTVAVLNSSTATITTDKIDYGPGELVTITGAGFQPNETITITLHEEQHVHEDRAFTAITDGEGKLTNTDFTPEHHHFGVTFVLTAKGQSSAFVAQTSFTDAATVTTRVTLSSLFRTYGQTAPPIRVTFCQPITDGTGRCLGINDKTIDFTVAGVAVGSVVTSTQIINNVSTDGVAVVPYDVIKNAGAYTIIAKFAGDDVYKLSQGTAALTVGKVTPTITWPLPAAFTYGTPLSDTQLNATAKDNTTVSPFTGQTIPGTYTYSIAAGTIVNAGVSQSISVTFTPTDTINYSNRTLFNTLSVSKAPLTVTTDNIIRTYGQPNPTLTGSVVGIQNNDPINATYSTTATQTSPAGSYDIIATLADPSAKLKNYTLTNNKGTLAVNKATLTITADSKAKEYGTDNPAFTATYTGFANNETENTPGVLSALPSLISTGTANSPVGTYPIRFANAVTATNYSITLVDGTLTVNKAASAITLGNLTQTYDGTPKSVLVTTNPTNIEGLTVTYDGSTTTPTNAGSYAVVASVNNPNYSDSGKTATLVINKAAQTINFPAINGKTYGDAPFTLNAAASSSLPVSFQVVSGSATVSGNVLTISGAGAVTLLATQAGDGNYNAASDVAQTFDVSKAQASISFEPSSLNQSYDGTAKSVNVVVAPAGLAGISLSYTQNGAQVAAPVNAGSYAVAATLANPNYEAATATGTLNIGKAAVAPSQLQAAGGNYTYDAQAHPATSALLDADGKPLRVDFTYTPEAGTTPGADSTEPPLPPKSREPQMRQVGATDPNTGFPLWYEDANGLRLGLCLDNSPLCLTTLPDQNKPALVAANEADSNFPDESFWWSGEAQLTGTGGITGRVTMGAEAAFANRIQTGDQLAFGRVRIRIDNLVSGASYRIVHPYGVDEFDNVNAGRRGINFTEDIGIDNFPNGLLRSRIAPFLTWDTFGLTTAEGAPPSGYVGDPTVNHKVTGSPFVDSSGKAQNYVRIERIDPVTRKVIQVVGETDLFTVSGKVSGLNVVPNPRSGAYNAQGNSVRLLATNPAATIYYTTATTTDGTTPADPSDPSDPANAARTRYTGSVSLGTQANLRTTIKFVAVDASGNASPVVTETYVFDPTVAGATMRPAPASQLKGVGPLDPATGFPLWYEDDQGRRLQLCLDNSPLCLTTLPNQERPALVSNKEADSNFPDESFWWSGEAQLTTASGVTGRLTLGTEAAFTTGARVVNGAQVAFGRVRIRIDNLVSGGTYRIVHPYGEDVFENVGGGVRGINFTEDIGIDSFPDGAMRARVAPFLVWDTIGQAPEAGGPPAGYVGDPTVNHKVTGSPVNHNVFRIERLDPATKQVVEVVGETDLFAVSGKFVNNQVPPVYAGTYNVRGSFPGNSNYEAAAATTQIVINKAEPTVDLTTEGTVDFDGNQHPASASVSGIGGMRFVSPLVTITYTPQGGGAPSTVAPSDAGTYDVTAAFAGTKNYSAKTVSSQLVINRVTPQLTWQNPADINYGTALGDAQLNAAATLPNGSAVPGTFTYTPAAGTVLGKGAAQTLAVTFTPTNVANVNATTANVVVNVINHAPAAADQAVATDEDTPLTITFTSTDADGNPLTFTVAGQPAHGKLGALSAPSCNVVDGKSACTATATYTPDADYYGADSVTFKTTDTQDDSNAATVSLTVNSVNDVPQTNAGADATINEGGTFAGAGSFSDPDDVDAWTATVDYGDGTGAQPLALNANKTFSLSHLYNDSGVRTVTVAVTDRAGARTTDTAIVSVTNVAPTTNITGAPASVAEGAVVTLGNATTDASSVDQAAGFQFAWSVNKDGAAYTTGAGAGFQFTPNDNGTYVVTLRATDKDNGTGTATQTITVTNVAPVIVGNVDWTNAAGVAFDPTAGVKVGTPVTASLSFTDAGAGDTHTAVWEWNAANFNGTSALNTAGVVAEANGSGKVKNTYTFTAAGIYTVRLTVTDDDTGAAQTVYRSVVVYDPAAGSESGTATINSPAGSYTANKSLAGTSLISQIYAKYGTDGTLGSLQNAFKWSYAGAGLTFTGSKMHWLVVSGNKTWLRGEGTTNAGLACYYLVSVVDSTTSAGGADKVRVKLYRKDNGQVIYDNQKDAAGASVADEAFASASATSYASIVLAK